MLDGNMLDQWRKLAVIENRRMRENCDGCTFGLKFNRGPRTGRERGERMADAIAKALNGKTLGGAEIMKICGITVNQWDHARKRMLRNGQIVRIDCGQSPLWKMADVENERED